MVLRLINRLAAGALAAEAGIEQWQKTVSSIVHTLLYAPLLAMPIVGYLANSAYGASTPFVGLFELPRIIGKNEEPCDTAVYLPPMGGLVSDRPRSHAYQRGALSLLHPPRRCIEAPAAASVGWLLIQQGGTQPRSRNPADRDGV